MEIENLSLNKATTSHCVSSSLISKWLCEHDTVHEALKLNKKSSHSGPSGQLEFIEDELLCFIFENWEMGMAVSCLMIALKSSAISSKFAANQMKLNLQLWNDLWNSICLSAALGHTNLSSIQKRSKSKWVISWWGWEKVIGPQCRTKLCILGWIKTPWSFFVASQFMYAYWQVTQSKQQLPWPSQPLASCHYLQSCTEWLDCKGWVQNISIWTLLCNAEECMAGWGSYVDVGIESTEANIKTAPEHSISHLILDSYHVTWWLLLSMLSRRWALRGSIFWMAVPLFASRSTLDSTSHWKLMLATNGNCECYLKEYKYTSTYQSYMLDCTCLHVYEGQP